jgi:hypothetical protein
MKKIILIILVVCMLAAVASGCTTTTTRSYDMTKLSQALLDAGVFSDILSPMPIETGVMVYGFKAEDIVDYRLYFSTRATAEEIGMFKCTDVNAAQRVLERCQARAEEQKETYVSYAPGEPPKIDDGYIKADGVYVFYIIGADGDGVREIMK